MKNTNSKKIKIIGILIIILLIIIIIIMMVLLKVKRKMTSKENELTNNNINEELSAAELGISDPSFENEERSIYKIKDNKQFFTIQNCIEKYESILNMDYSNLVDENNKMSLAAIYGIETEKEKAEYLNSLIDIDYKTENAISSSNIISKLGGTKNGVKIELLKANKLVDNNTNVKAYSAYAKKIIKNKTYYSYYIIKLSPESRFSIYPLDSTKYSDIDKINIINNTKEIEIGKYNTYVESTLTEGQVLKEYVQNLKRALQENRNYAYELLDNNYRDKRFSNLNDFTIRYINRNKNMINMLQAYQFQKNTYENYNEYTVYDLYGNTIYIYEFAPNDYKIFLDNYTVDLDIFKENYEKADDSTKISMQIGKIKQMLNLKDYENIYSRLNTTFRNNNYKSVSELEKVLKENTYENNSIEIEESNEKDGYYVCECNIKNKQNETEEKKAIIVIKLIDSINFEFSFSFE